MSFLGDLIAFFFPNFFSFFCGNINFSAVLKGLNKVYVS